MKIIKSIGIGGVAGFTKALLPISPGVTYLYGHNALDNGNANAVGKSVLSSAVSDIMYDTPMVGTRQDRPKQGTRIVKWKDKQGLHVVRSAFKGKTEHLIHKLDGVDVSKRTTKSTRAAIRAAFAVSEEDYRTYGYLDSITPHPLVRGTSAARKAFFVSFFQLDRLDSERKVIAKHAAELKKTRARYAELRSMYEEVKRDLLTEDACAQLTEKKAKLELRVARLRVLAEKAAAARSLEEFRAFAKPHIKAFRALVPDLQAFEDVYKRVKREIRESEVLQEQLTEYREYLRDLEKYEKRTADLDMETPLKVLQQASLAYQHATSELRDLEFQLKKLKLERPSKVERPDGDVEVLRQRRTQLQHELKHAQQFDKGQCPTCGQDVKARSPSKIKAELSEINAQLENWVDYEAYRETREQWQTQQTRRTDLEAQHKKMVEQQKTNIKHSELYAIRRELQAPEKVAKPKAGGDTQELKAQLQLLNLFEPQLDLVAQLDAAPEAVAFDLDELTTTQDRLAKISAQLEVHESVAKRAQGIKKRLRELKTQLEDEDALELLLGAYSDKGAKALAVQEVSKHLMGAVNRYAPIAFQDYTFEFVWGPQVSLLVHRPTGTTDVRKLSGAESKLFTMILTLAQLMFVPKSKRLSLLILDEPFASFSGVARDKFHQLMPHLLQLIPSVLVVTPKSEERYPGAVEYTVYRDQSGSSLRQGHPSVIGGCV